jgi:hypothetical protein
MQLTREVVPRVALRWLGILVAASALLLGVTACNGDASDDERAEDEVEMPETTDEDRDLDDEGTQQSAASPLSFSGSGDDQTDAFDVAANWELRWEADDAFQAELFNAEGESRGVIIETDEAGDGATFISEAGEFTLEVSADGDWNIEVLDRSGS